MSDGGEKSLSDWKSGAFTGLKHATGQTAQTRTQNRTDTRGGETRKTGVSQKTSGRGSERWQLASKLAEHSGGRKLASAEGVQFF